MLHVVFNNFQKNVVRIIRLFVSIIVERGCDWCPLYGVVGCLYVRGCNSIEFNDRSVGTVAAVCYIVDVHNSGVSVKRGLAVYNFYYNNIYI